MRIGFLNDPLFDECDPTQWVSVSREVILHFLKTEYQLQNAYFLVFNIKLLKNILKMKYSPINALPIDHNILSWKLITAL